MTRSDSFSCCSRLSVRLGRSAARHQDSKEGEYQVVREGRGGERVVYRQDRRSQEKENYIFHLSHPDWTGWLVGPQVRSLHSHLLKIEYFMLKLFQLSLQPSGVFRWRTAEQV